MWMSRIKFLKCFLIGAAPLNPAIFEIHPKLRGYGRELLHMLEGGGDAGGAGLDTSGLDAIDEPIPEDVRKTIVDRRVSALDVFGSWDAKKKGEGKG